MSTESAFREYTARVDGDPPRPGGDRPTDAPRSGPPEDTAERLLTLPRGDAGDELRISVSEYEGNRYVSARIWERDALGSYWPSRRGISVRRAEIAKFIEAMQTAQERLGGAPR